MSKFSEYIGSQFGNPRGIVGSVCCLLMNIINNAMYENTVRDIDNENIKINSNSKLLDIGYGNGKLISKLYRKYGSEIYGIDISEDMKLTAEKHNAKAKNDNKLNLSIGDCCKLEYANDTFDAITTINTIYFWSDTVKGLSEINRVLKRGGVFINAVYSKEWLQRLSYTRKGFKFFNEDDYIRLGKKAGFSDVCIKAIAKDKSYMVCFYK